MIACVSRPDPPRKISTFLLLDPNPAAQVPLVGARCSANLGAERIEFRSGDAVPLPRQGTPLVAICRGSRWDAMREVRPIVYPIKAGAKRSQGMSFDQYAIGLGAEYPDSIVLLVGRAITGDEAERLKDCEGLHPTPQATLKCLGIPLRLGKSGD